MHSVMTLSFIVCLILTTGCSKSRPEPGQGPSLATSPKPVQGHPPSLSGFPKAEGNSQLEPGAPDIVIGLERNVSVSGHSAGQLPPAPPEFRPEPLAQLTERLAAVRKNKQTVVNVKAAGGLGADVIWTVLYSAARAGFTEARWALDGGGALALHMPAEMPQTSKATPAAHVALFIGAAGATPKMFIGPSGDKLPVSSTRGLTPLAGDTKSCPAAPKGSSPTAVTARLRSLGDPVCKANGANDYWVVASSTVTTKLEEFVRLTAAIATPTTGCTPRIALAAPTQESVVADCQGAIAGSEVAKRLAAAKGPSKFSAVARAASKPLLTEIDLSKSPKAAPPGVLKRLAEKAREASKDGGHIALGRVATSDNDASRDGVTRALAKYLPDFKKCYAAYLEAAKDTAAWSGSLIMGLAIGADGKPKRPGFSRKGAPPDGLKTCVAQKAQLWSFPVPKSGAAVQVMIPVVIRAPGASTP